jgi:hypothetical protein
MKLNTLEDYIVAHKKLWDNIITAIDQPSSLNFPFASLKKRVFEETFGIETKIEAYCFGCQYVRDRLKQSTMWHDRRVDCDGCFFITDNGNKCLDGLYNEFLLAYGHRDCKQIKDVAIKIRDFPVPH